jgi:hypothetical protein
MRRLLPAALLLLIAGVATAADDQLTRTVPVSDPNWFFSPCHWYINGDSFAETQNIGASFKIGFTARQASLAVDVSMLDGVSAARWPLIRSRIDDAPTQDYRLKQADTLIPMNATDLPAGPHTLTVWFVARDYHIDRWLTRSSLSGGRRVSNAILDSSYVPTC